MISVIVIAYNAEKTINRCIDSILSQSHRDFELIIIDDGSVDATLEILKSYSEVDSRIRIRSRSNKGVAYTRQEGLDMAKGDYTIFVDADDWVETEYLHELYDTALKSNSDIVICDIWIERGHKTEYSCEKPMSLDSDIILAQLLDGLHGTLWNKLISRDAYLRTSVRFLPKLNCCEDQYVLISLLSSTMSVAYVPKALYHYDKAVNGNSITNNWLDFPVEQRVYFIRSIQRFIVTDIQKKYYCNYIGRVAYTATASPRSACPNYSKLFKVFWPFIKQSEIPKFKKIICFLRMMGIVVPIRWVKVTRKYIYNLINNK